MPLRGAINVHLGKLFPTHSLEDVRSHASEPRRQFRHVVVAVRDREPDGASPNGERTIYRACATRRGGWNTPIDPRTKQRMPVCAESKDQAARCKPRKGVNEAQQSRISSNTEAAGTSGSPGCFEHVAPEQGGGGTTGSESVGPPPAPITGSRSAECRRESLCESTRCEQPALAVVGAIVAHSKSQTSTPAGGLAHRFKGESLDISGRGKGTYSLFSLLCADGRTLSQPSQVLAQAKSVSRLEDRVPARNASTIVRRIVNFELGFTIINARERDSVTLKKRIHIKPIPEVASPSVIARAAGSIVRGERPAKSPAPRRFLGSDNPVDA